MAGIIMRNDVRRRISAAYLNHYVHGFPHPDRTMGEHDLIYMCEGEWEIWLGETPFVLKKDQVLILPAGLRHSGKVCCPDHTKTIYLHVSEEEDRFLWEDADEPACLERTALPLLTQCKEEGTVRKLFGRIAAEFASGHLYRECRMSALFQLLLTELYAAGRESTEGIADTVAEEAIRIIREEPGRFHTVKELAALLYVSPRTVSGHFRKATGTTVHRYEMNMKLDLAAVFLKEYPQVKLHEAAENFGFYDEFHFSRAFSERFQISPAAYRKRQSIK